MKINKTLSIRIAIGAIVGYLIIWLGSFIFLQHTLNQYERSNSAHDTSVFLCVSIDAYTKSLSSSDQAKIKNIQEPQSPEYQEPPSSNSPFFWVMLTEGIQVNQLSSSLDDSTSRYMVYTRDILDALTPLDAKLILQ